MPASNIQNNRQMMMAVVWAVLCVLVLVLQLFPALAWLMVGGLAAYVVGLLWVKPKALPCDDSYRPHVAILVACKNEERVIGQLVAMLRQLSYPHVAVWIADDGSDDKTFQLLSDAAADWPALHIVHRPRDEPRRGKSAVLNDLCRQATGDIILVLDADATIQSDFIEQTIGYFTDPAVGALQVRKEVSNADENDLTKFQALELRMDALFQEQRYHHGGLAELRGNGMFVRRTALDSVGGFSEQTVTDDLDLSLRLPVHQWRVVCRHDPAVREEAVLTFDALWKQRLRWAEGGFQRNLDFYQPILSGQLGVQQTIDHIVFAFCQYGVPVMVALDLAISLLRGEGMASLPLALVPIISGTLGFYQLGRRDGLAPADALKQAGQAGFYFMHWLPVMVYKLGEMLLRPARMVWIKTDHYGTKG